jgi:aconitate hydratase
MPAGDLLKYRSNIPKYAEFVFAPLDRDFAVRALKAKNEGKHNIIVAGLSYGQGSSREHAAICPMYLGVKAVIAKSFERIHAANLINFGILPLTFADEEEYGRIMEGDALEIENIKAILERNGAMIIKNISQGKTFEVSYDFSRRQKTMLLAGGALNIR